MPLPPGRRADVGARGPSWQVAALGLALVIAAGFVMRRWGVASLVYMPRHLTVAEADPGAWGVSASAVRVPVDSAQSLYAWLFPRQAAGRRPCGTVLLLHGNAGDVTQFRGLGEWLAASGLRVLAVD